MSYDFISRKTTKRLVHDIKQINKNPLDEHGIYYIHDDTNMLNGYAMIVGPKDTPYFGGFYFFKFEYTDDYPYNPPKVVFCTNGNNIRMNPNLYVNGTVCVSILNTFSGEQWSPCQNVRSILLSICTLLCTNPFLNEPGIDNNDSRIDSYNNIINFSNIDIAVCDIVSKKSGVYLDFFGKFEDKIMLHFNKNVDELISFCEKMLSSNFASPVDISFDFFEMNARIDYKKVLTKLKELTL